MPPWGMLSLGAAVAAASLAAVAGAGAQGRFVPEPPGSTVASRPVRLDGAPGSGQWRVVTSKTLLGAAGGQRFYQWYLSFYAPRQGAYRLRYQSPRNGGPLSRVTRPQGAPLWFPLQDLSIAGVGELMRPGLQQVVVQSHEMAADCGSTTVAVFAAGAGGAVVPVVSAVNPCELGATIGAGNALVLHGPYYAANAPMCCPTKPHASAELRYRNGRWTESPDYYKFYAGRLPPP